MVTSKWKSIMSENGNENILFFLIDLFCLYKGCAQICKLCFKNVLKLKKLMRKACEHGQKNGVNL